MDIEFYFQPIDSRLSDYKSGELGNEITAYTSEGVIPEITDDVQIVLLGVKEDRNAVSNKGCADGCDYVRSYFYKLQKPLHFNLPLIDIGNLFQGESVSDTYHALSGVLSFLIKRNCIPVILGGSQDLTYANYLAYENLEQVVNLVTVDRKFDLGTEEGADIHSQNYLSKILLHQPNYLFHYSNIGQQTYFINKDEAALMDTLYFDEIRLGDCRAEKERMEPVLRNADVVSFDIGSVKAADAPGNQNKTPNGFTGDECCAVTRYAGISEKVTSMGFYEYNPAFDIEGSTAHLIAQMIWYFIDGVCARTGDLPALKSRDYLKYKVSLHSGKEELEFLKSIKTDRWWMNVPVPGKKANRYKRHQLVPCTYNDYQSACNEELPDLWLKTYKKLLT